MALYRKNRPRLMMFNTFYIDLVEHRFWRYHEPQSFDDMPDKPAFRGAVEESYQQVDKMLGIMIKQLPANAVVAVVSEHGMAVEKHSAEIGERRYSIVGNEVKKLANLPDDLMVVPIARWIAYRYPDGRAIDQTLMTALASMTVVQTGLPLFNVHRNNKHEIIIKFNFNDANKTYQHTDLEQLTIRCGDKEVPFLSVGRPGVPKRSAMHAREGIMLIQGEGISAGKTINNASIIDIAPTLLQVGNMPPLVQCDGKVLDILT